MFIIYIIYIYIKLCSKLVLKHFNIPLLFSIVLLVMAISVMDFSGKITYLLESDV